jgi:spore maturation protein CgeB
MSAVQKLLVLDGIAGIPLGLELCETLVELGVPCVHFDCLQGRRKAFHGLRSAWSKLVKGSRGGQAFHCSPRLVEKDLRRLIGEERPTQILVVGFIYKFFDPAHLRVLAEQAGAGLVLYDTDSCNLYARKREFVYFIENELPAYHRILSCSAVAVRMFRETRGLDAHFVPFGARPLGVVRELESIDVLFVGSADLRRILLLEGIRDRVTVRGNRWRRNHALISEALRARIEDRPVWGEELHRLLAQSRIVLNITRSDFYGAETGINLRIFEAVAAGCFLLTEHTEEICELFRPGEEIETYRSSRELAEKVEYFLVHEEEREAIALRGHQRFLADHTWRVRLARQMLPLMER